MRARKVPHLFSRQMWMTSTILLLLHFAMNYEGRWKPTHSMPCAVCRAMSISVYIANLASSTWRCLYKLDPSHHWVMIARNGFEVQPMNNSMWTCRVFLAHTEQTEHCHQSHSTNRTMPPVTQQSSYLVYYANKLRNSTTAVLTELSYCTVAGDSTSLQDIISAHRWLSLTSEYFSNKK